MSGILGPYAVAPATVTPLLAVAAMVGPAAAVLSLAGRRVRRRLLRRRAARLAIPWHGVVPLSRHRSRATPEPDVDGGARGPSPVGRARRWHRPGAELAVPLLAGLVTAVLVGGAIGLLAGALTAVALRRWLPGIRSRGERRVAREHDRLVSQLPLAADLLAACLGSSGSPAQAAAAVAATVGGPLGARLRSASAELMLGAPPVVCWERLGDDCPALAPLARCLVRTSISGAPPAAALAGLAVSQRAAAGRAAHARVRRAGVLATAPLGLCFLPAFVLIGIVPVVVGLAASFAQRL